MDRKGRKQELETQLAKCRELAAQFPEGETAKNIHKLIDEIEQQIRALEK